MGGMLNARALHAQFSCLAIQGPSVREPPPHAFNPKRRLLTERCHRKATGLQGPFTLAKRCAASTGTCGTWRVMLSHAQMRSGTRKAIHYRARFNTTAQHIYRVTNKRVLLMNCCLVTPQNRRWQATGMAARGPSLQALLKGYTGQQGRKREATCCQKGKGSQAKRCRATASRAGYPLPSTL